MLPNYTFTNETLLTRALTHRSAGPQNYERLEFLGDRLVNTMVADWLVAKFPNEVEGQLAKRHASIIRTETLALIAEDMGLPAHIHMSTGEAKSGGALKPSILADVVEACCAAVYLDSNFDTLQAWAKPWFADKLADIQIHDAKTHLQEILQADGRKLPDYVVLEERGQDHNKEFTIEVQTTMGNATGQGASKKIAEQNAAKALLEMLGLL